MAQDFLSQDEVDALLKGVSDEPDEPEDSGLDRPASAGIRPYNLATQDRIVRRRMPTLDLINERFVRNLKSGLFGYMRRHAEISVGPVNVQKYSEFVRSLPVPASLNLVQIKPLRGTSLIVLDPKLVFLIVDNMFGGDGRFQSPLEGRDFTATEQRIIQGLLRVIFHEYEKAWSPVYPVKFEYVRSEINSQFAHIATPSDMVVALPFSLEFNGTAADMHFCLPYSMIEPVRETLHTTTHTDRATSDEAWLAQLATQVQEAEVRLSATLGTASVTLRQILQMKAGDVIPVAIPDTIEAHVNRIPVLECRYGVQNGQYALKVERFLAQSNLEPDATRH